MKTILPRNCTKFVWRYWWIKRNHKQRVWKTARRPKRKLSVKKKDIFRKKIFIKKFLLKKYNFKKIYQLKSLYVWAKKIPGNNILNFYLSLEFQLSTVCLRMHFFWRLNASRV